MHEAVVLADFDNFAFAPPRLDQRAQPLAHFESPPLREHRDPLCRIEHVPEPWARKLFRMLLINDVVAGAATCPVCALAKGERLHAPSSLSGRDVFECSACLHVWGCASAPRDPTPPREIPTSPGTTITAH